MLPGAGGLCSFIAPLSPDRTEGLSVTININTKCTAQGKGTTGPSIRAAFGLYCTSPASSALAVASQMLVSTASGWKLF
ncbi:hypothetical protein EYF80_029761 [Liparis tanakae]|uniref:Uncharacterized protein n=1 Tax=Liparis tanakae TaxID=230148 RepID=A0A4Z2H4I7_9TELE|nr:hypothetical protein EYF80_029761 [Liparis tanakae]